ncbi:hypothetical protein BHE74_00028115 [Ensete ventricosum]|nr:hypothetical protein GW17_00016776 [Ensete ventricosum]RWW64635.1 hypothetical protein BHE74_00028115 [Ensete ventricosum]RZR78456.1 hypothetical protein BHM03_00003808 [Ensete ventricosum]
MGSGKQTTVTDSPCASADAGLFRFLPDIQVIELLMAIFIFVTIRCLRQGRRQGLVVLPVVGMLPSLLLGIRKDMYEWITSVLDGQGGTFLFRGPWFTNLHCVVTADPRNLEHLLKVKFPNFHKGEYFRGTVCDLLGDGIFSADDEIWRRQRKTASLEFHSAEFRAVPPQRAPIDLQDVLLRLTFDNVCMIALGTDPGCLRPGLPEIPFAKAFEDATQATLIRFITPTAIWKSLRYFDLGSEGWLRRSIAVVDEFAYEVIRTRREELSSGEQTSTARSDLLTVFTKLRDEDGTPYSDKFLRDVCVNFILAGRDTSSVALAWFFWLLNRHPEVEKRILGEIRKITEGRGGDEDGELVFKPEEVKRMEYLHAALSEALRLYPSVPVDHKEVRSNTICSGAMQY